MHMEMYMRFYAVNIYFIKIIINCCYITRGKLIILMWNNYLIINHNNSKFINNDLLIYEIVINI